MCMEEFTHPIRRLETKASCVSLKIAQGARDAKSLHLGGLRGYPCAADASSRNLRNRVLSFQNIRTVPYCLCDPLNATLVE